MHVPRFWAKTKSEISTEDGKRLLVAWGWGDDEAQAKAAAERRLERLSQRALGARSDDGEYGYGSRPLREEILQVLGPHAVITRNRHGAVILNATNLLFLDVDLPPASFGLFGRLFGKKEDPAAAAIARLRTSLREAAPAVTFRLYRTAAGLRAVAIDRAFDPAGPEAQALMQKTGTDPAFAQLCQAQKSFRARLTPKPWRCNCPNPPGEHPREEGSAKKEFSAWCRQYEHAAENLATCRYLETVGKGNALPALQPLIEIHDQATRCGTSLVLA